jgi:hypothetical protein
VARLIKPEDWQPGGGIRLEDAAERVVKSTANMSVIAGPGAGKTEHPRPTRPILTSDRPMQTAATHTRH